MQATQLRIAALLCITLVGCRPDPAEPPDPDDPVPPVSCDDDGAPISLVRTEADSALVGPAWSQLCTLCPATSVELLFSTPGGTAVPSQVAWTSEFGCGVALSDAPLPDVSHLEVEARIVAGQRSGEVTLEQLLTAGRGSNPADLGAATWRIPLDDAALRIPTDPVFATLLPSTDVDLLLHLGPADAEGGRPVTLGVTEPGSTDQDLCEPTTTLDLTARLDRRQLGATLSPGDRLPPAVGGPVARGALQARMSSTGSALQNGALLAVLDLASWESDLGLPPDETCALLADQYGTSPCVPCGDPADGTTGLPTCLTALWEFGLATAATAALVPVDPDNPPVECLED